jgi:hypothetical protein
MHRFCVYCWEMGYTKENPYHTTNDRDEAELLAFYSSKSSNSKWYVFDNETYQDVYVRIERND